MKRDSFQIFLISIFLIVASHSLVSVAGAKKDCTEENVTKEDIRAEVVEACQLIEREGKKALITLQPHKFCGGNYVWIQTEFPKMVMHPIKSNLVGKDIGSIEDYNSDPKLKKKFFAEFAKAAKENPEGSWVEYMWPKPGSDNSKAVPKLSFVKKCSGDLNWIVGAGIYADAVDPKTKTKNEKK